MNPPNYLASVQGSPNQMRKLSTLLAVSLVALFSTEQITADPSAPVTLVKAGRLLDPRTGNVLSPAAVLIESGKIKEVGPPSLVQATCPATLKPSIWAAQLCCRD